MITGSGESLVSTLIMLADRAQKTLFSEPIKSIGFDQIDILQDIMTLYCPQGFECDPTYSKGNFYKSHIPQPKYKFDIHPQVPIVVQASADHLPIENGSVSSINFDPPFEICTTGNGIQQRRFSYFESLEELLTFYDNALKEFSRILKRRGILVFKCQDLTKESSHDFVHIEVYLKAIQHGFFAVDLFVLLAKQRVISPKHKNQRHARKYHSYFWVFQKQSLN